MNGDRAALVHLPLSSLAVSCTVRHDLAMLACMPMSLLAGVAFQPSVSDSEVGGVGGRHHGESPSRLFLPTGLLLSLLSMVVSNSCIVVPFLGT